MTLSEAKDRIEKAFRSLTTAKDSVAYESLLPTSLTSGKLYEAYIIGKIAEKLVNEEGYQLRLINSQYLALKSSPGPINRNYPRIDLRRNNRTIAELWTDIEFLTLSYSMNQNTRPPSRGDYHELDILIVEPKINGRPNCDQIWLGVECKNTGYKKGLLKEILGIRRELSLLQDSKSTKFIKWPRVSVPANPPSCLLVYSTDKAVNEYSMPGTIFGIDFFHEELKP